MRRKFITSPVRLQGAIPKTSRPRFPRVTLAREYWLAHIGGGDPSDSVGLFAPVGLGRGRRRLTIEHVSADGVTHRPSSQTSSAVRATEGVDQLYGLLDHDVGVVGAWTWTRSGA